MSTAPRFVIFASYGNDSCALIQWAADEKLENVAVVYSDTGWAASGWPERVEKMEAWVRTLGFSPHRVASIGFRDLAREKKGFPSQRYQWCSYRLKIEPGIRWLAENDPEYRAVCLVGVRREESEGRANFPEYMARSMNHGGRVMLAPLARISEADRNAILARADIDPLPHRSRECKCINSNKADLRAFTAADISEIEAIEAEIGRPMFRPHKHMGASGIRDVMRWARSGKGRFDERQEDLFGCDSGWCGI